MSVFNVRLADDLADRFDAVAALQGGRSALLRRGIAEAADAAIPPSSPALAAAARGPRDGARIMVRPTGPDALGVDLAAAAMGLSRAGGRRWGPGRLRGKPTFSPSDGRRLLLIQGELRRIGVNVNQIARALNTAVLEGRAPDSERARARLLRAEIRGPIAGVRKVFDGNLAYWHTQ